MADEYADLIYNGLWFGSLRRDLQAYVGSSQQYVTGTARLKLYKGSCTVTGRRSRADRVRRQVRRHDRGHSARRGDVD